MPGGLPSLPGYPEPAASYPWLLQETTAIVVASNAPDYVKQGALSAKTFLGQRVQVCDGTNDNIEIQAALDALPSSGGKVLLSEGQFNVAEAITISKGNITLAGAGPGTLLKIPDNHNADLNMIYVDPGADVILSGIEIRDMKLDGNRTNQTTGTMIAVYLYRNVDSWIQDSVVDNLIITGFRTYAVRDERGRRNWITNCKIDTCNGSNRGTILINSGPAFIINNTLYDCDGFGIGLYLAANCTVIGNKIFGVSKATYRYGINAWRPRQHTILGNYVSGCDIGYYLIYDSADNGWLNTVIGNRAYNCVIGYAFSYVEYSAIIGNVSYLSDRTGFHFEAYDTDCVITSNIVYGAFQEGDLTFPDGYYFENCQRCVITKNISRKSAAGNQTPYGMRIRGGNSQNNTIEGNDVQNGGATANFFMEDDTTSVVRENKGYNPVGITAIAVGVSPFTYSAGASPETIYVSGGVVTSITKAGNNFGLTNGAFQLEPYESIVVTYTGVPTMFKDVH